jgi:hypothetical protein
MDPLPLSRIRLTGAFWTRWQEVLFTTTLPTQFDLLESTGRLANFRRAAGKEEGRHSGMLFNDSDVYKWIEACAYALANRSSESLRAKMDAAIDAIVAAQLPDGYINTYIQLEHPDKRWMNLGSLHEMYCIGHMIEAGVAVHECLGDDRLLDASIKAARHVMSVFGPGLRRGCPGHEEIELALVKLTRATGDPAYREYARWLVDARGQRPSVFDQELSDPVAMSVSPWAPGHLKSGGAYVGDYAQDHAPIREHTQVVGHAVRAMYLYAAAADLADGQEDQALEGALERAWANLTRRRMYLTGGIGPSASNEGFTVDYDLPNFHAYAETCAAIGLVFWGRRMLEMTGDTSYADVIERALYNGAIAGISVSGDAYFYENPLEARGKHVRQRWFECACCPPNIARLIAGLGEYVAGEADGAFYIHQYAGFDADTVIRGVPVKISLESEFPWEGTLKICIAPKAPVAFALHVRIPEWSDDVTFELPGSGDEAEYEGGYGVFERTWEPGDVLSVDLGMKPAWVEADPRVRDNLGRSALTRGPLVYCAESPDLGFAPQLLTVDLEADVEERFEETLGGIQTISVEAVHEVEEPSDELYPPYGTVGIEECAAKFIPYYAWANRGASEMAVWVRGGVGR